MREVPQSTNQDEFASKVSLPYMMLSTAILYALYGSFMGALARDEVILTVGSRKSGVPPIASIPPLSSMAEGLRLRANEKIGRMEGSLLNIVLMIGE